VAAILASQFIGLLANLFLLSTSREALPPAEALGWAVAAGLSGIVGLGAYYQALSRGTMGLIAPLAALIGAALPALVAILTGEDIGPLRLTGVSLGLVAVVLISLPGGEATARDRRAVRIDLHELPLVAVSGIGFAGFYLCLDRAAAVGGETWWPLLGVRSAGLAVMLLAVGYLLLRPGPEAPRRRAGRLFGTSRMRALSAGLISVLPLFLVAGLGDLGGNAFFVLANAADALSVAVVLSSLYPVITMLLAGAFLHERLRRHQLAGVGVAVLAVALIAVG
jgi:drug/metabolite transporter (DMT)-like permease